jgi:hypothetical protein
MNVLVFVLTAVRIRSKAVWLLPASSETYNLLWSSFRSDCIAGPKGQLGQLENLDQRWYLLLSA